MQCFSSDLQVIFMFIVCIFVLPLA